MTIKSNLYYFKRSISNPEQPLDLAYMFLDWDKNINDYVSVTKKLKELLATIKTLKTKKQNAEDFYADLYALWKNEFAGASELNCFLAACDTSRGGIIDDFKSFKYVVDLYLEHRDFTEITPKEWAQALLDSNASRRKSSSGENKLRNIAEKSGFTFAKDWDTFIKTEKVIANFSKDKFDLKNIKQKLGLTLKFNNQGKLLDIILKNKDYLLFLEAKHLKDGGGAQNHTISELINIVKQPTGNSKVFYGAFLDGIFSNVLLNLTQNNIDNPNTIRLGQKENKTVFQQRDIVSAIKAHNTSFWFNTAGFTEFVKDFALYNIRELKLNNKR